MPGFYLAQIKNMIKTDHPVQRAAAFLFERFLMRKIIEKVIQREIFTRVRPDYPEQFGVSVIEVAERRKSATGAPTYRITLRQWEQRFFCALRQGASLLDMPVVRDRDIVRADNLAYEQTGAYMLATAKELETRDWVSHGHDDGTPFTRDKIIYSLTKRHRALCVVA